MTPTEIIQQFLNGITNKFRVLTSVSQDRGFSDAASLELAISLECLRAIVQNHSDATSLEKAIRDFLKQRWAQIAHSPLAYLEYQLTLLTSSAFVWQLL